MSYKYIKLKILIVTFPQQNQPLSLKRIQSKNDRKMT